MADVILWAPSDLNSGREVMGESSSGDAGGGYRMYTEASLKAAGLSFVSNRLALGRRYYDMDADRANYSSSSFSFRKTDDLTWFSSYNDAFIYPILDSVDTVYWAYLTPEFTPDFYTQPGAAVIRTELPWYELKRADMSAYGIFASQSVQQVAITYMAGSSTYDGALLSDGSIIRVLDVDLDFYAEPYDAENPNSGYWRCTVVPKVTAIYVE